ncbi:hypothetical protein [Photobacterium halotolerans]|uniref:hypothetical protein n=1 Tax=Photobacterium halotolerans TaxID=265726 RepID=UPI001373533B|nr:hypothetical protein [Photobacterium halotolerans]NAW88457.1 hypothetical protein [Photobacterium halotolerans]
MKKWNRLLIVALSLLSFSSHAEYNANMTGVVTQVLTYTDGNQIYFLLKNQPTSHPSCKPDLFAIDASTSGETRHQVLSRLLTAYATGKPVNIGYDKEGDCAHTWIRVHRVG